MGTVLEREKVLVEKRAELHELFEKSKKKVGDGYEYDLEQAQLTEVRSRNEELSKLDGEWRAARDAEELAAKNAKGLAELRERGDVVTRPRFDAGGRASGDGRSERKGLGAQIVGNPGWAEMKRGGKSILLPDFESRTLFQTSAGWDPEDRRTGRVVLDEQEERTIADYIPTTPTTQSTVLYMEETTFTRGAVEVSEGGTYGEAAFVYTERSSEVRKIGAWLPVTDEQLEDVARMEAWLQMRLGFGVKQRLAEQILVGNGTAPNLRGVNNVSGINTNARGSDPIPDAIYKGMVECRVNGFAEPDLAILHPNDWQDVRLLRSVDGVYIYGNPDMATVPKMWGKPVLETTHQTENTGVVGAFRQYSELAVRRGVEIAMTDSHSTHFVEGKKAIRADIRAALIFYRPLAFCTVTGI